MEEKIFVRCLVKNSFPYKIVKSIKPKDEITVSEVVKKLGTSESRLKAGINRSLFRSVSVEGDYVRINKGYDFVIVGDRKMSNEIHRRCRKYNAKF